MGKRNDKRKLKLCVLSKMKQNKHHLFGAFTNKLSKQEKILSWIKLYEYAKLIGAIPPTKEWTYYLRDVWWPNVRKSTTEKIDNARSTGRGGGTDKVITDVDDMVLDIIGKESPVVTGLDVPESMEAQITDEPEGQDPQELIQEVGEKSFPITQTFKHNEPHHNYQSHNYLDESLDTDGELQGQNSKPDKRTMVQRFGKTLRQNDIEKSKLQIELLKIQIYKSRLKCRKLEVELGISNRSSYTANIQDNSVVIVDDTDNTL